MAMNVGTADDDDDRVVSAINTTPLVDVMLVLLIIFLITIPVVTQTIPVSLPKETNIAVQTKPENINIAVNSDGDIFWNQALVPDTEALFQRRDADPAVLDRLQAELYRLVEEANRVGRCPIAVEVMGQSRPALMDERLQVLLEEAAEARAPGAVLRMPSGAGHDAQYLARVMPAAMMFVPSIGGISHHWTENTSDEDIALGAEVYVAAAAAMLEAARR